MKKIKQNLTRRIALPFAVIMLAILGVITALVFQFTRSHDPSLMQEQHIDTLRALENSFSEPAKMLQLLAAMDTVPAFLETHALYSRQSGAIESISESEWQQAADTSSVVQEVLQNTAARLFDSLTKQQPVVKNMVLTSPGGEVLASTEKTELYQFSSQDWWRLAQDKSSGRVLTDGLIHNGLLTLAVSIPVSDATPPAVLAAFVDFDALVQPVMNPDQETPTPVTALVSASHITHLSGSEAFLTTAMEEIKRSLLDRENYTQELPVDLIHHKVEGTMLWAQSHWLCTFSEKAGSALAFIPYLIAGLSLALILIFFWLVYIIGYRQGLFPLEPAVDAGEWVVLNALKLEPYQIGTVLASTTRSKDDVTESLEKWYKNFKQDMDDEVLIRTQDMHRDLELAKEFQQAYLNRPYPAVPAVHIEGRLRLVFYHVYEPASALGGDFYDILTLAPDCAGVFIADVMGHGSRSALITAIIRTLIGDLTSQGRNARHFVSELNKQFCDILSASPQPMFASAFYFVADTTGRIATFSTAGHPAPIHIHRSLGRLSRLEVAPPNGAALGLIEDEVYTGGHCRLLDGDVFIFFTDGLYEAANEEGEEFGMVRLEKTIRKVMYKSAEEITKAVMTELRGFVGEEPVMDDICMVGVEVCTSSSESPEESTKPELPHQDDV